MRKIIVAFNLHDDDDDDDGNGDSGLDWLYNHILS